MSKIEETFKKIYEGLFSNNYDYKYTPAERDYIKYYNHYLIGNMISMKFLDIIGVSDELKNKFKEFEATYGRLPKFSFGTNLANNKITFQKTLDGKKVDGYFTEEDINEIIDKWVETYKNVQAEDEIFKETPEAVVKNVVDFVKDHKLEFGCALFGVAALSGAIPAIVKKYKSEEDIREAVSYYMNSIDWDKNDSNKAYHYIANGKSHTRVLPGNKSTSKEIFKAVTRYAKKNGITVREAFHELDGKKAKGLLGETDEDFYRFDILKDNDGVLTIEVWGKSGKKPKTFEIDTNTYQTFGDAQFSWNESVKKSFEKILNEQRVDKFDSNSKSIDEILFEKAKECVSICKNYTEDDYDYCVSGELKDRFDVDAYIVRNKYRLTLGDFILGKDIQHWEGSTPDELNDDFADLYKMADNLSQKNSTSSIEGKSPLMIE